ncbi:MAG: MFS transporter [Rhodospirillales bacterium]|nr:MFS transporter [Rhodospirillales bacterium]
MIDRRTVLCLGISQLISWGISYYLIGAFGELIAADLGWSRDRVYGGFALALLVMGMTSPLTGSLIDRYGGRKVMVAGSLLNAGGCIGLAFCQSAPVYYAAWICLGLAMRLTLYDAAFATLARIGGPQARGPIAQITLLGGLASTTFWPVAHILTALFEWRGALIVYAGFALLTVPLHRAIPDDRYGDGVTGERLPEAAPIAVGRRQRIVAGSLFAILTTLANFLNAGMSAHMIGILAGLGLTATAAVGIASLRGIGQSAARLWEVLFGQRVHPLTLNLFAALLLPLAFIAGLFSAGSGLAAVVFAFVYGAGNGLLTITRGTLPLILFDHRTYGAFVGRLVAPGFLVSAAAPLVYAMVIDRFGEAGGLFLSIFAGAVAFLAAVLLKARFARA